MKTLLNKFVSDESGATAIEYGLIASIIGVGIIVALGNVKTALNNKFDTIQKSVAGAQQGTS